MPPYIPWLILGAYLLLISVVAVVACIYDKLASKTGWVKLRLPEKTLFIWAGLGGGVAMFLTMLLIRHKTKHPSFMIGIPVIIVIHAAIIGALVHFGVLPI